MSLHGVSVVYHFFFSTVYLPCQWHDDCRVLLCLKVVCVCVCVAASEGSCKCTYCSERCENRTGRRKRIALAVRRWLTCKHANWPMQDVCMCASVCVCCRSTKSASAAGGRRCGGAAGLDAFVSGSVSAWLKCFYTSPSFPFLRQDVLLCPGNGAPLAGVLRSRTLWFHSGSGGFQCAALPDADSLFACLIIIAAYSACCRFQ